MTHLKPLMVLHHGNDVWSAQWNRDASRILSASVDKTARIWTAQRGRVLRTLRHEDTVGGGRWNHDESRILTWSSDGAIQIWDAASGQPYQRIVVDACIGGAVWSSDENHLAFWYTKHASKNDENPFFDITPIFLPTLRCWTFETTKNPGFGRMAFTLLAGTGMKATCLPRQATAKRGSGIPLVINAC
jgi:WD40 repeat protein